MMYEEEIRLCFGHSLVIPNTPKVVNLAQVIGKHNSGMDIQGFGFWDSVSPSFGNYYPDVDEGDLIPEEGDFIYPTYRALSEVIVHKEWNPIDFSLNGVLKKSMSLLKGQTVYPNHDAVVGNELGAVLMVDWEEASTVNGVKVPAGINSKLKIDGKSNPKIARAINMDPPSIHSTSVTVRFLWEKSHPEISQDDFFRNLGSYDKDGKMYRRIATRIKNYNEISLVSHGADPFAKKKDADGNIVLPKHSGQVYNSEQKKSEKSFYYDFKVDLISNSEVTIPDVSNNTDKPENKQNMNFLIQLAQKLGLTGYESLSEDELQAKITEKLQEVVSAKSTAEASLMDSQTQIANLNTRVTELTEAAKGNENLTELQTFKDTAITNLRNQVLVSYNKLMGDKAVEEVANSIKESTDMKALQAFKLQYDAQLEEKYPMSCKKCGSNEVSRATTQNSDDPGGKSKNQSLSDIKEKLHQEKIRKNSLGWAHSQSE